MAFNPISHYSASRHHVARKARKNRIGRRAGRHWQSAGSAIAAYVVTCAAMFILHALQPSLWLGCDRKPSPSAGRDEVSTDTHDMAAVPPDCGGVRRIAGENPGENR